MGIPSKQEILEQWAYQDVLIHQYLTAQEKYGLSDDELWRSLVAAMADRNANLLREYQALLARTSPVQCVLKV